MPDAESHQVERCALRFSEADAAHGQPWLGRAGRIVAIVLAGVGVLLLWKMVLARAYTFHIVDLSHGVGSDALKGRIRFPEGAQGDEIRLVALDEGGRRFHVDASPAGPGQVSFRIPAGFPTVRGNVELQFFVDGVARGSRSIGQLRPHHESFEVHMMPGVRAFVNGGAVEIEVHATTGISDVVLLFPLRTENQAWGRRQGQDMMGVGTATLRGRVSGPYVTEARQIEFEIATTRYEPDGVTIEGAALSESGDGAFLTVSKPAELTSSQGRRVRVPAQTNPVTASRTATIRLEVLDGHPEWVRELPCVSSPQPESLGLKAIFVEASWSSSPAASGGGGFGPPSGDVRSLPPLRLGPVGPLHATLPPRQRPQPAVKRYAVPIEPAR